MTSQLAKVMERLFGLLFLPQLSSEVSIGPNQFAYVKKRGSRDALLFLVPSWLQCFLWKCRVALYCSDVSGAFDKVDAERLLDKLRARSMPDDMLAVIRSWLRCRTGSCVRSTINRDGIKQPSIPGHRVGPNAVEQFLRGCKRCNQRQ